MQIRVKVPGGEMAIRYGALSFQDDDFNGEIVVPDFIAAKMAEAGAELAEPLPVGFDAREAIKAASMSDLSMFIGAFGKSMTKMIAGPPNPREPGEDDAAYAERTERDPPKPITVPMDETEARELAARLLATGVGRKLTAPAA